ncbi:MAG: folate family ECF transporter S component [Ruminococcaceae bacterium]|nr:folate family ECF transporter S component [Oscillospiraceae bacterium]
MSNSEPKLYTTPLSASYWKDAAAQLFNVRMLCIAAILIAVRVALKKLSIPVGGPELEINFGFFVNALGASIFGPVVAIVAAAISDTLGCIVDPSGAYFFPFIFVEIGGSLIFALWLWRAKLSATRIILSRFCVSVGCNLILNPLIMIWYYAWLGNGQNYAFLTIPRVVKNLALFPFEGFLLVLFLGALMPALARIGLLPKGQMKPVLTKAHFVLLAVLLVIAIVVVVMFYGLWLPTQPKSVSTTMDDVKVTLKADRVHYNIADMNPAAPFDITVTVKNSGDGLVEAVNAAMCDIDLVLPEGVDLPELSENIDPEAPTAVEGGKSVKFKENFADIWAALGGLPAGDYKIAVTTAVKIDGKLASMIVELPIKLK